MIEQGRRNYICLFSLFFLFVLSGCFPTKTVFHKQPGDEVERYQVVQIPDFDKTDATWVPYDSSSQIPDMLAERLRKTNEFGEISRSESGSEPDKKVLLVEGVVTGYSRGCKFCEWFFFGINDKGKSSMSIRVKLIDATTGNVLTDAEIQGRAKDPGYGSSRYERIVDEIVDLIHDVNREKS
ncbi:MAG TPA: DUF4410 domain-containing protein [Thermodesulfobacteriota bacterium]|nr:DUF4410 domain-containing protein [Thermodesulfobacteriota bacterium]